MEDMLTLASETRAHWRHGCAALKKPLTGAWRLPQGDGRPACHCPGIAIDVFFHAFLDLPALSRPRASAIHLPGSKSISNRVLLLAALSQGTTK